MLVFLNPDTVVAPGALRQLARALEDPDVGIAMARLRLLDEPEKLNSSGVQVHVTGIGWAGGFGEPADSLTELHERSGAEWHRDGDARARRFASSAASPKSSSCTSRTSSSAGARASRATA